MNFKFSNRSLEKLAGVDTKLKFLAEEVLKISPIDFSIIEYNGEKHCIADWADILNYDYIKLKAKLKTYSLKDIIEGTCKPKNVKFITYDNQTKSAKEWAEILNITHHCLITRLRRNWSLDRIFNNYNKDKLCLN